MSQEQFVVQAAELHEKLTAWRRNHPGASFDEIAEQVRQERQALMGGLLKELAEQAGCGEMLTERSCPGCGGVLHYKGKKKRVVLHGEGSAQLERGYHYCDECGHSFSPSG